MSSSRKERIYLVKHEVSKSAVKLHLSISQHIIYLTGVEWLSGNVIDLNAVKQALMLAEQKYCKTILKAK
jgi:hypothetical protein